MKCAKCYKIISSLPCPYCGSDHATELQKFGKEESGGTGQRKAR